MIYGTEKRPIPDCKTEYKRKEIYQNYRNLTPIRPKDECILGLEYGNKKTGRHGNKYEEIFVWNLPPRITCPGASSWCETHCYNSDERRNVYPIDKWCENLWVFLNREEDLEKRIISQLTEHTCKAAVRLHSSGDFFSKSYIDFWHKIIEEFPDISFWAYTRSWRVAELEDSLYALAQLPNMQIFASCDDTMQEKPIIPVSLVFENKAELKEYAEKSGGVICPEQYNIVPTCADCGFCMKKGNRDVLFQLH